MNSELGFFVLSVNVSANKVADLLPLLQIDCYYPPHVCRPRKIPGKQRGERQSDSVLE